MRPVEIPEQDIGGLSEAYQAGGQRVVLARDQAEYEELPAVVFAAPQVPVVSDWRPSADELAVLLQGGVVRLAQWTFGNGYHPISLTVPGAEATEDDPVEQAREAALAEQEAAWEAEERAEKARAEAEALSHGVWAGEA